MIPFKILPISPSISVTGVVTAFDVIRPTGFDFSGEMHDFWEIVFLESGRVEATADGTVIRMIPGQLLFHRPMEFHRIRCLNEKPAHLLILSFTASGEEMAFFQRKLFSLGEEQRRLLFRCVHQFAEFLADPKNARTAMNQGRLLLELLLCELTESRQIRPVNPDPSAARYREIVGVLESSCDQSLTLCEIARRCRISESTLKQTFHRYCDRGVMQYFTELKIRKACSLLQQGKSIPEICDLLGFENPTYFYRVFKRKIGLTPRQYRLKNR